MWKKYIKNKQTKTFKTGLHAELRFLVCFGSWHVISKSLSVVYFCPVSQCYSGTFWFIAESDPVYINKKEQVSFLILDGIFLVL